jgi:hypothetical protein
MGWTRTCSKCLRETSYRDATCVWCGAKARRKKNRTAPKDSADTLPVQSHPRTPPPRPVDFSADTHALRVQEMIVIERKVCEVRWIRSNRAWLVIVDPPGPGGYLITPPQRNGAVAYHASEPSRDPSARPRRGKLSPGSPLKPGRSVISKAYTSLAGRGAYAVSGGRPDSNRRRH